MPTIEELPTPALVVDLDRLENNLTRMAARVRELGTSLRPHVKTHKCVEIGRLQLSAGARGITVSTLHEADVFATAGFDDVLWAYPVIPSRLDEMLALTERVRLGLVVDGPEAVELLARSGAPLRVWIKVDCGYHRCGVAPDVDRVAGLAERILTAGLEFGGLLSHSGDAYTTEGRSAMAAAADRERDCMTGLASSLGELGIEVPAVSVGSTPGIVSVEHLRGVTEARPGNYAFFDRTQLDFGSCGLEECALTVVTTVISSSGDHCVVDAGALALSPDPGPGDGSYGGIYRDLDARELDPGLRLVGLSQEHGKLSDSLPWGTRLRILPNHSCLTTACFTWLHVVRGREVVDRWRVWSGRS